MEVEKEEGQIEPDELKKCCEPRLGVISEQNHGLIENEIRGCFLKISVKTHLLQQKGIQWFMTGLL